MAVSRFTTFLNTFDPDPKTRGKHWEHVCKWFLETDPVYCAQLKKVWLWDQWRGRWGPDAGIDLVAEAKDGTLWAIQAKAYASDNAVTKRDVDSFLSESARAEFRHRLLIATTSSVSQAATWAVAEWTAAILEDEHVQARLLGDARQGRLHHAVLGQLLLYAYGRRAPNTGEGRPPPGRLLRGTHSTLSIRRRPFETLGHRRELHDQAVGVRDEHAGSSSLTHPFHPGVLQLRGHAFGIEVLDAYPEVVNLAGHGAGRREAAVAAFGWTETDESAVREVERVGVPDDVPSCRQAEQISVERLGPCDIGDPDVHVVQRPCHDAAAAGLRARCGRQRQRGHRAEELPSGQRPIFILPEQRVERLSHRFLPVAARLAQAPKLPPVTGPGQGVDPGPPWPIVSRL